MKLTNRTKRNLEELTKINIGCGQNICLTYVNVDIREDSYADVICDIRDLPFCDERFDHLLSTDVLEHVSHREIHSTFKEWLRVLKVGGTIKLQVPNILVAFDSIKKKDYGTALHILYGAQDYKENCHYMGFTPEYLMDFLRMHKVQVTKKQVSGLHIVIEGIKK